MSLDATLVSAYFDLAELQAMHHKPMHMSDYLEQLDRILSAAKTEVLQGAGKISHSQAMRKAEEEYRKFQVKTLSPVENEYLASIKKLGAKAKKKK